MSTEFMGGFRLVRKLGEGPRAEVYLGHPMIGGSDALPVAVKIYRPAVGGESIMTEIEALTRAAGDHSVELTDLAGSPDNRSALILQRLGGGSLAKLLTERGRLRTGEAITVLGPLATTLVRLRAAGVVHGAIAADRVLFDPDGAPVLARYGSATLIPTALSSAALSANEKAQADLEAFSNLARSVLVLVRDERAHELAAWLADASKRADDWLESVTHHIYELGDASAIDLHAGAAERAAPHPGRLVTSVPLADTVPRSRILERVGAPEWLSQAVAPYVVRFEKVLRRVHPRVWITAAGVAIALVTAIVLVPSSGSDATAEPPQLPRSTGAANPAGPVQADDPVAALVALWEERDRCIRDVSVLCLDSVDQANSSALELDRSLILALQSGGESPRSSRLDASRLTVTESLGDTAILALDSPQDSEPASILVMRSETGWRIRDYLE